VNYPPERVAEEVKKLFIKGKRPSVGLEFAQKIGFTDRYWPEISALRGVPKKNIGIKKAMFGPYTSSRRRSFRNRRQRDQSRKNGEGDKLVLVAAALCHDLGKPATTEFVDGAIDQGSRNGRCYPSKRLFRACIW